MEKIAFTRNYNDASTNRGFQFEFFCDRCGSGFRSPFKASAIGGVAEAIDVASSLFGNFYRAANLTERVRDAGWQKAHDQAFIEASEALKRDFKKCPRCSNWVCPECWNEKRGLCKDCAPDLGVEMSAAQASKSVEEVWAHAAMAEEDKKLGQEQWRETIRATCPSCGEPLPGNTKFCPSCGAAVKQTVFCGQCGAKLTPGTKFCPDCGAKVEAKS